MFYKVLNENIGEGTWNQSTGNINSDKGVYVKEKDLIPGDIAFLYDGKDTITSKKDEEGNPIVKTNHVGIYVGKNKEGKNLWVHCNAADNTVALNTVSYWKRYERLKCIDKSD